MSRDAWIAVGVAVAAAVAGALTRVVATHKIEQRKERRKMRDDPDDRVTPSRKPILSDLGALRPPVREALQRVLVRLERRGLEPRVFETLRTAGRSLYLEQQGTGIRRSTHRLGLAADIIDKHKLWGASDLFWRSLREEAEREGFVTLTGDKPHVQAIAVSEQPEAWELHRRGAEEDLDALARRSLESRKEGPIGQV